MTWGRPAAEEGLDPADPGHREVEEEDVRPRPPDLAERGRPVVGLGDHFDALDLAHSVPEQAPERGGVIGDEDAERGGVGHVGAGLVWRTLDFQRATCPRPRRRPPRPRVGRAADAASAASYAARSHGGGAARGAAPPRVPAPP